MNKQYSIICQILTFTALVGFVITATADNGRSIVEDYFTSIGKSDGTSSLIRNRDEMSAEIAYGEMLTTLGSVPSLFQVYPKSAVAAGWALMKSTDFNKNTALPVKVRELVGLAVAAQIPCTYCVYYHTEAAKAQGATEQEILEAVHVSSLVRHWSTVLHGSLYDYKEFQQETDAAFKQE